MIHAILKTSQMVAVLGCASSCVYYALCLWSGSAFLRRSRHAANMSEKGAELPPISILKPLKGIDPEIYESFRSHCLQDYPEYEIVFGVSDKDDPAIPSVEQLQREFPGRTIKLMVCPDILGANVKVSNLHQMAAVARYGHLLVNDSDIRVEEDYLRRVVAPLLREDVGMVTCLYRGIATRTIGSRLEALGISTDFCASVLAAQQFESGLHFGLGSTLMFRRRDLERIGGFVSIVDYLADDYELGRRISGLGLKVVLSDVVVETHLPSYDLRGFLLHQMRWARGVRDARLGGYIGLASTFGIMWALLAVGSSRGSLWSWGLFGAVTLLRWTVAWLVGREAVQDRQDTLNPMWLISRDLIAAAVWFASFGGHTVTWRGDRFELKNGRLIRIAN